MNKHPWTFVAIQDEATKRRIREAVEEQGRTFYEDRADEEWLDDLAHLGSDWRKLHIVDAPWVVVVFAQDWGTGAEGGREQHYYVEESVGIAVGFLLTAVRQAGLAALTHTPSPMDFLEEELDRPENERAYLVVPVGYPAEGCRVPDLDRKDLDAFIERI